MASDDLGDADHLTVPGEGQHLVHLAQADLLVGDPHQAAAPRPVDPTAWAGIGVIPADGSERPGKELS